VRVTADELAADDSVSDSYRMAVQQSFAVINAQIQPTSTSQFLSPTSSVQHTTVISPRESTDTLLNE